MQKEKQKQTAINTNTVIKFKFLKLWLRILTLVCGGAMLMVNLIQLKSGSYSIVSLILGLIIFITGLIENSWEFDLNKKQAIHKMGFILFPKKILIDFSVINSLNIDTYKQPARWGTFTEIYMLLEDGKKIAIDRDKTKRLDKEIEHIAIIQDSIRQENYT